MLRCVASLPLRVSSDAPAPPPATPLQVATNSAVQSIDGGQALGNSLVASIPDGDFTEEYTTTNAQITYWQNLQLQDPGNGDTLGTLGYFAVSARDFWSGIGDLFDAGAPPAVIGEQFQIWSDYSVAQAGKSFEQMQPIDLWFRDRSI